MIASALFHEPPNTRGRPVFPHPPRLCHGEACRRAVQPALRLLLLSGKEAPVSGAAENDDARRRARNLHTRLYRPAR